MVSKVQPGREALARMGMYRAITDLGLLKDSYHGKFALAAFIGVLIPLATFIVYLLLSRTDFDTMYPALAALILACFAGFLGTLWMLRELLQPIDLTAEALRDYIDSRKVPDLPIHFTDRAGRLMEGTQYTLTQLHETITRLERVSDTDDLTGIYNRRAGEKRLAEEVARAERDLQTFHVAFFDVNNFKQINEKHGHSAGDAVVSHLAALLQLNTRRGDWVARWGGDEFLVGLHRNRALKMVMERIVKAIAGSPCEIAPGLELRISVSCGVADYRFGSGVPGVLSDGDRAMFAAKDLSRQDNQSHIAYRNEISEIAPREASAEAAD
jgi:diguanylate cyclase (GGDEF)-like protein